MAKVFKWITNCLLIVVISILLGYFIFRVTNKIEIYNVKTGSMEAKIHVGDYILVYKKNSYNVGDIVTYTSNNGFITHRIVRIDGDKITTKGDANNTEDDVISSKIIVGKVIMSGGLLNVVINYKYALVGIVLSFYLFSCYFNSVKDEENEHFELDENNEINVIEESDDVLIKIKNEEENDKIDSDNDSSNDDDTLKKDYNKEEEKKEQKVKGKVKKSKTKK